MVALLATLLTKSRGSLLSLRPPPPHFNRSLALSQALNLLLGASADPNRARQEASSISLWVRGVLESG